jgi:3-dehydroquinate dehydratase II
MRIAWGIAPVIPRSMSIPLIYVLNGPNLNLLGTREPEVYGTTTLDEIAGRLREQAARLGVRVDCRQSNHEGVLIDWLHEAHFNGAKAVLLNAGGYTHTSIALHDAIKAITVPVIEVHLSDPHKREEYRHISFIGMAAHSCFAGHGADSYTLALDAAAAL